MENYRFAWHTHGGSFIGSQGREGCDKGHTPPISVPPPLPLNVGEVGREIKEGPAPA